MLIKFLAFYSFIARAINGNRYQYHVMALNHFIVTWLIITLHLQIVM
jgi:hypothetical protein